MTLQLRLPYVLGSPGTTILNLLKKDQLRQLSLHPGCQIPSLLCPKGLETYLKAKCAIQNLVATLRREPGAGPNLPVGVQ